MRDEIEIDGIIYVRAPEIPEEFLNELTALCKKHDTYISGGTKEKTNLFHAELGCLGPLKWNNENECYYSEEGDLSNET